MKRFFLSSDIITCHDVILFGTQKYFYIPALWERLGIYLVKIDFLLGFI